MIGALRLGPINSIQDAAKAFHDLELFLGQIYRQGAFTEDDEPTGSDYRVWIATADGAELWELVAGAGITLTPDSAARTLTITSP